MTSPSVPLPPPSPSNPRGDHADPAITLRSMQAARTEARAHVIRLLSEVWAREAELVELVREKHGEQAGLHFAALLAQAFNDLVGCTALIALPTSLEVYSTHSPSRTILEVVKPTQGDPMHVHWHSRFPSKRDLTSLEAAMGQWRAYFAKAGKPDQEIFQIRVSAAMVRKVVR